MENGSTSFKNVLVLIVILCSISFFEIRIIPESLLPAIGFLGICIMILFLLFHFVYDKGPRIRPTFATEIYIILFSVALSMLGAYYYHGQPLAITAIVQRYMYYFLFYFFLHQIKPDPNYILRLFIYLGLTYAAIYLLQFIIYPVSILQSKAFYDRGTLRIFLPGSNFLFITFFLSMTQFFLTKKKIYIVFILIALVIFIILGTRQVLFSVLFISLLYILLSKKVKNKLIVSSLILLSIVAFFFIFQDIFLSMIEVSKKQQSNIEGDVRYRAISFFLFDFFPNRLSYIIGNGVSSANSEYGVMINNLKLYSGFYQSDIGIIGDFSKFGVFFIAGQLIIMIRILTQKIRDNLMFIKLIIWSMTITLLTGGSFASADVITSICAMLYLVDIYKNEEKYILKQA